MPKRTFAILAVVALLAIAAAAVFHYCFAASPARAARRACNA